MFTTTTEAIKNAAIPILPNAPLSDSFAPILEAIGDAEIVMIGEASHGTHEFYHYRAELTKQLITQKGFTFLCCEADWPDAYRVNRYVQHGTNSRDTTAEDSLGDFRRFPMWMWRNTVVQEFVEWLRSYNATSNEKVAFYGMDLYSFFTSMDAVIEYLEKVDPKDAKLAKKRYGNFERFQGEAKAYGQAAAFDLSSSFEKEALAMLVDLRKNEEQYLKGAGGLIDGDELFYTQVNAEIVKNAEEYYRKMYHANESTWNLRDKHMVDVVSSLLTFHKNKFPHRKEKIILWAHNSHLGDARETGKGKVRGEWNVGQLIRERFGLENTFNIGFTTYRGSVTAAKNWHKPAQCWKVRNGMFGSYEHLLHLSSEQHKQFILLFRSHNNNKHINKELISELIEERNERYIGVVYRPDTEKASHYSKKCCLPREYDCVIHVDETTALQPMDVTEPWNVEREVIAQLEDPDLWPELDGNALPKSGDVWRMVVAKKLNEIGIGLFEKKQFPYALQKFNKALQYNIDAILKCEILMNRAECHFQGGQWLSLIQDCAEILKEEPNKIQAHLLLGQAYEKVGEAKNSKHHFHLASKLAAEKPHHIEPKRRHTSF